MRLLSERGADLGYHDPHIPALSAFGLESEPCEELVRDADVTVIVTAHPSVDHDHVGRIANLVLDFRGVTRAIRRAAVSRL